MPGKFLDKPGPGAQLACVLGEGSVGLKWREGGSVWFEVVQGADSQEETQSGRK